ncbi:PAAR domain-containing protein [Rosenbergiella epipactidis]|uniref:PAAR domain-containing protein n=1 Tax=Rosenbergiella epipactidis TaxID=1544694 RepID=UPI001F4F5445|nr:PAAR domain-containing protein [Rosenbergiella epipactidis]
MLPAARVGDIICHGGAIASGSSNVTINGLPAAMLAVSATACGLHGGAVIATGSGSITINGYPAARLGDITACGSSVVTGSGNVFIG